MVLTLRGIKPRYEVRNVIERGGMGVVYEAYDKIMKRPVALKTLLEHHLHRPTRLEADRDKIDFLLVQYFSHCAPSRLEDADVEATIRASSRPLL